MNKTKNSDCVKIGTTCQSKEKITQSEDIKMKEQDNASKSLAHTKWNCKYHMILNLGEYE